VRSARLSGVTIRTCVTEAVAAAVEPENLSPSSGTREMADRVCRELNGEMLRGLVP
jgi:hypothetical protein